MSQMFRPVVVFALVASVSPAIAQQPPSEGGLSSRRTTAVTYEARRDTKVDLIGTPLLPRARGEVEIETEASGPVRIKASVRGLPPATELGPQFLTYVLWAIPPQGRPKNLGELRPEDGKTEIEATSGVQTFSLIVTAEPYYAVTTPCEVVIMENVAREDTRGRTSVVTLQHEIVPRAAYTTVSSTPPGKKEPPDVQQARHALVIARGADAERFAATGLATAQRLLTQTEGLVRAKESKRDIISTARAAVQAAEEARQQAVRGRAADDERLAREAGAAREQAARDQAARDATARATAEDDRRRAEAATQQAVLNQQQAEAAAQQAAADRQRADEARREAELARADAVAQVARAEELRAKAEGDQAVLRATLMRQFSDILETRDTARGLIVNVGDVLFQTGRFELLPAAREKLARFSGIVLGHAGLAVQCEGFTDSTGTVAVNERLSQQRADAVGDYLRSQGIASERVTTRGYGPEHPVASNDTREGRSQNRRVELVVAGDVIGTPIGAGLR